MLFFLLWAAAGCHTLKPPPPGTDFAGERHAASHVKFLADITTTDANGTRAMEQQIFDEAFALIKNAQRFILLDMFLFNSIQGDSVVPPHREVSGELVDALLARKAARPSMTIILITDPINEFYGSQKSGQFKRLRAAGIQVTLTNLRQLRDSNVPYSFLWRPLFSWMGEGEGSLVPHPFGNGRVSVRSWLAMLNFKGNHRKVLIADAGPRLEAIVMSANPHDASSAHHNIGVRFSGAAVNDLLQSELAVLRFSNAPIPSTLPVNPPENGPVTIQVLTEKQIQRSLLTELKSTRDGDSVDIAMFYLSENDVVREIIQAHRRGARVRVLLDPNKDAFGYKKNGIPNRTVAARLIRAGIFVRWFDTHGEQGHSKMLHLHHGDGDTLILGSANFTRRNLENFNLETNVAIRGPADSAVLRDATTYFDRVWRQPVSASYKKFSGDTLLRRFFGGLLEFTGLGTF